MRLGVIMIIGLFVGAFSAHFLLEDRGYVLIRFMGYSMEMSVPGLVLSLLALYAVVRLTIRILEAPRAIGGALGARERAMAQGALTRGLAEISAGNLTRGERILTRQATRGDAPMLAYLEAARAAQLQGATSRRDGWLKRAREHAPGDVPAVLITQAELELADGQAEAALGTLRRLEAMRPKHARCLALQATIYEERGDWRALEELMPRLRREKALSPQALADLERRLASEALRLGGQERDGDGLRQHWKQLASRRQQDGQLTREYVRALIRAGDDAEAATVLRRQLRQAWDPELLYLVGQLSPAQQRKLQPQVTAWRRKRPDDPALLYAAAVIGAPSDPAKALERLEASLEKLPRLDAFELYGRLLEQQGRHAEATRAFQAALGCTPEGQERGQRLLEQFTPEGAPANAEAAKGNDAGTPADTLTRAGTRARPGTAPGTAAQPGPGGHGDDAERDAAEAGTDGAGAPPRKARPRKKPRAGAGKDTRKRRHAS